MYRVSIPIINQRISLGASPRFAFPHLPPLRIDVEMDESSYELAERSSQIRPLQVMAQKLADTLKEELQWTLDQHAYVLRGVEPGEKQAAYAMLCEELQRKYVALRARCEKVICTAAARSLKNISVAGAVH